MGDVEPRALLGKAVDGDAEVSTLDPIKWAGPPGMVVTLQCREFTSLCPVTGQPDFGELNIEYEPRASLAETKSLKYWLRRYRDRRAFNEVIIAQIAEDFARQILPEWVEVTGEFGLRGGIAVTAKVKVTGPAAGGIGFKAGGASCKP